MAKIHRRRARMKNPPSKGECMLCEFRNLVRSKYRQMVFAETADLNVNERNKTALIRPVTVFI